MNLLLSDFRMEVPFQGDEKRRDEISQNEQDINIHPDIVVVQKSEPFTVAPDKVPENEKHLKVGHGNYQGWKINDEEAQALDSLFAQDQEKMKIDGIKEKCAGISNFQVQPDNVHVAQRIRNPDKESPDDHGEAEQAEEHIHPVPVIGCKGFKTEITPQTCYSE